MAVKEQPWDAKVVKDELTHQPWNFELVRQGRSEGLDFFKFKRSLARGGATGTGGRKKIIGTRWVISNKGDTHGEARRSLCVSG